MPVHMPRHQVPAFDYEEASIADLQKAMSDGRETAESLTRKYLERIDAIDKRGPAVNAVIELNPDALAIARDLDAERRAARIRGPLHGVPVMLKDNIDTHDKMMCTAGSLALVGSYPARDSFLAERLRAAGAIILAKANLSEWANYRGSRSSSGWSGRGGQTNNPYALDRNPSGSSSGSAAAVAASMCAVAVGTETDGSIMSPASVCGVVGVKPTVGLISRSGIVPIAHSQDTAGPLARTVSDAAILLGAMTGVDPRDPATKDSEGKFETDYTKFLDPAGLQGARIGVLRSSFGGGRGGRGARGRGARDGRGAAADPGPGPGPTPGLAGPLIDAALAALKSAGAVLIDPLSMSSGWGQFEGTVLNYEFKADLNAYLAALPPEAPVHSMQQVIDFNESHKDQELQFFGQEQFLSAIQRGPLTDQEYLDALEGSKRAARAEGIDAVMDEHNLDAILGMGGGPAGATDLIYGDRSVGGSSGAAAVAGYPNITVPAGLVYGMPVGLAFFGRAWSEPRLLAIAYAFEQTLKGRRKPMYYMKLA
jgi:amidase